MPGTYLFKPPQQRKMGNKENILPALRTGEMLALMPSISGSMKSHHSRKSLPGLTIFLLKIAWDSKPPAHQMGIWQIYVH